MLNFAHRYDLFSKPFNFLIGQQGRKSTKVGGIFSLSIAVVSFSYLVYLLINFFSYKIYPSVSSSIKINDRVEIDVDNNFFLFQILINGIPIEQYEAQQNKKYITQRVIYENYSKTEWTYKEITNEECNQVGFPLYKCISPEEESNLTFMNSKQRNSGYYTLLLGKCINEVGVQDNCASELEIDNLFQSVNNYFTLHVQIKQYNSLERKFETGYKQEYIKIDSNYVSYSTITMKKAQSYVTEGLIIQQTEQVESIIDYTRLDSIYIKDTQNKYDEPGFKQLVSVSFLVDQITNNIIIQHAQLTQILAQFMSLFISLLLIGLFARFVVSNNIHEDFMAILFADSFKQQAYDIIEYSQLNKSLQSENILEEQPVRKSIGLSLRKIVDQIIPIACESKIQKRNNNAVIISNQNENQIEKSKNHNQSLQINQTSFQFKNYPPQTSILINQTHITKQNRHMNKQIQSNLNQQSLIASLNMLQSQQNQPQTPKKPNKISFPPQSQFGNYSIDHQNQNIFLNICHKENSIQQNKFNLSFRSILKVPMTQKIKQLFSRIFCYWRKEKKENENKQQSHQLKYIQDIYEKMNEEVLNTLNIYNIYQDLIRIKMAIKILFTEDQYAALHFCTNSIFNGQESDTSQYNMKQEIEKIIIQDNENKGDLFHVHTARNQGKDDEVIRNSNASILKYNLTTVDEGSLQQQMVKKYFDSQQVVYSKRFIDHYKSQKINAQNKENQVSQNRLNCEIIGDNEGNIQNESLNENNVDESRNSRIVKDYRLQQNKNNSIDFDSMSVSADDSKHHQIYKKNIFKVNFSVQQPQNQQINNYQNHLQLMELIDKDDQIRKMYLNKFIERHNQQINGKNISVIDANIFNSLLK